MRLNRMRDSEGVTWATVRDGAWHRVTLVDGVPVVGSELAPDEKLTAVPSVSPSKVIGVGLNYATHAKEAATAVPTEPITFAVHPSAVCGDGDAIVVPEGVHDLDYEAELGVVIGRECKNVPPREALEVILGYTCVNDVSARSIQLESGQWTRGKSFDTFCPVGPHVVTADEIDDPDDLAIGCRVDGETRQEDRTSSMIFSVAELISFISRDTTLLPGDLICTGTPGGVAFGDANPRWLIPGSSVTVTIEGIGSLTNAVVGPER